MNVKQSLSGWLEIANLAVDFVVRKLRIYRIICGKPCMLILKYLILNRLNFDLGKKNEIHHYS